MITTRCKSVALSRRYSLIGPLAAAAALLAPEMAMAVGNNLTMTGATYDTTAAILGTGALNGGYGVTPTGACYPVGAKSFTKDAWVKAPLAPPAAPQLIMGDQYLYMAEDTSGYPVYGSGSVFIVGRVPINDGNWHHLDATMNAAALAEPSAAAPIGTLSGQDDSGVLVSIFGAVPVTFTNPVLITPPSGGYSSIVTSIGGGGVGFTTNSGSALSSFSGEIDEAECWADVNGSGIPAYAPVQFPRPSNSLGLVGEWALNGNGLDSSTWSFLPLSYNPVVPLVAPSYPSAPAPAGGFPLAP